MQKNIDNETDGLVYSNLVKKKESLNQNRETIPSLGEKDLPLQPRPIAE